MYSFIPPRALRMRLQSEIDTGSLPPGGKLYKNGAQFTVNVLPFGWSQPEVAGHAEWRPFSWFRSSSSSHTSPCCPSLSLPRSTGKRLPISCYALHSLSLTLSPFLLLSRFVSFFFCYSPFLFVFFYLQIAASLHDSVCAACSLSRGVYCACSAHVSMSNSQEQKTNNQ